MRHRPLHVAPATRRYAQVDPPPILLRRERGRGRECRRRVCLLPGPSDGLLIVRGVDSFVGFPGFDDAVTNLLDNPAWHALTGRQASQGERREQAARYQPEISPLGAVRECTTDALDELATLCGQDPVALLCDTRELPRHRFRLARTN